MRNLYLLSIVLLLLGLASGCGRAILMGGIVDNGHSPSGEGHPTTQPDSPQPSNPSNESDSPEPLSVESKIHLLFAETMKVILPMEFSRSTSSTTEMESFESPNGARISFAKRQGSGNTSLQKYDNQAGLDIFKISNSNAVIAHNATQHILIEHTLIDDAVLAQILKQVTFP